MAKHSFWFRIKTNFFRARRHSTQGFTLLELLVVVAIAGGIVAGLLYIVVQIMTSDQRESSRSETQREMQQALDYISAELREAVYVYSGDYLACSNNPEGSCKPFTSFLPSSVSTNSVPVLAFWKQQPFPQIIKTQCAAGGAPSGINCLAGQSYALVVYSLRKNDSSEKIWKGKARITRYVLSQADSKGALTSGYVDPGVNNNFISWPYGTDASTSKPKNLQTSVPNGNAAVLVDYVSFNFSDTTLSNQVGQTGSCPNLAGDTGLSDLRYTLSPPDNLLTGSFAGVRSFYACVLTATSSGLPDPTRYRDIVLFLKGSASGRPGVGPNIARNDAEVLPTLQTRVFSRSVLGRRPIDSSN